MSEEQTPEIEDQPIVTSAVDQLSSKLLNRRMEMGLTVERVAMATKISMPFITALEEGKLDKLPELVFSRGFIRNMCKLYEIEAQPLVDLFNEAIAAQNKETAAKEDEMVQKNRGAFRRKKKVLGTRGRKSLNFGVLKPVPFAILSAGLFIGIAASYYFITSNKVQTTKTARKSIKPQVSVVEKPNIATKIVIANQNSNEAPAEETVDMTVDQLAAEDGQLLRF